MRKQITGQSLTDNLKKWINLIKHSKFTFVCLQLLVKKKSLVQILFGTKQK